MSFSVTVNDNVISATMEGPLDSNVATDFKQAIMEKLTDKTEAIEINAEKIKYISSSGLRILVSLHKKIESHRVVLINPTDFVLEVLKISNIDSIIKIQNR